ncbi:MAG: hypothetical protein Q4A32_05595 [Lachnospiraceae bacterium]|nr:hypothetical protein [Lachnospiraceae bacterium]
MKHSQEFISILQKGFDWHYHPVQRTGNHHYTASKGESGRILKNEGWKYERISWYAAKMP